MRFPLRKVIDYAMTKPIEVDEAYRQFFGDLPFDKLKPEWEQLFLEWLMFDYKPKIGSSFLIEYVLKNPDKLEEKVRNQFQQIAETHKYGLFEILKIEEGQWFLLEDIYTGKTYKVYEEKGTTQIKRPGQIPGRVANVDGLWYLVGTNSVYFPITYTKRLKDQMRKMKVRNFSPKDTVELLRAQENHPPKMPPKVNRKQIIEKRKELQARYEKFVQTYGASLPFTDLLGKVNEENQSAMGDFWQELMKNGIPEKFFFEQWELFQDIWNYFPHKCLNDLSPIEMFSRLKKRS